MKVIFECSHSRLAALLIGFILLCQPALQAQTFKVYSDRAAGITVARSTQPQSALPAGPGSVRIMHDAAWIVDGNAARILRVDQQNRVRLFGRSEKGVRFGDMTFGYDERGRASSIWVVDIMGQRLLRYNNRGELELEVKQSSDEMTAFSDVRFVEADRRGNIYVADVDAGSIFMLNYQGKYVDSYQWSGSAFTVAPDNSLLIPWINDENVWIIRRIDGVTGRLTETPVKGLCKDAKLNFWGTSGDKTVFTAWTGGPAGRFIGLLDANGRYEMLGSIGNATAMQRFLSIDSRGNLWRAVENYSDSPENLEIIRLVIEDEAEG